MGDVYEAQDLRLPRSVALKVLKPSLVEDRTAQRRFDREARLAASLNHPNICTILDIGEADGLSFIAMELLQGESLKQRLRSGPMPVQELLAVAIDVTVVQDPGTRTRRCRGRATRRRASCQGRRHGHRCLR